MLSSFVSAADAHHNRPQPNRQVVYCGVRPERPHDAPEVLVVGIAVVDAIARTVDQFPSPGGLRFFDQLTLATGGNAASCSIALARLGVRPSVVAQVGADALGDFVIAELARDHVDAEHVVRDQERSTSFSFVSVASGGERSFIHTAGANASLRESDVTGAALRSKRIVFVTGTMLMDSIDGEPTARVLRAARAAGARTVLDTVYVEAATTEEWRRRVLPTLPELDYFVPSEPEARAISGESDPARMADYFRAHGVSNIVIKLGAQGVYCVDRDNRRYSVPAFTVRNVVDATGAGDCWCAGFIAGLLRDEPIEAAARFGCAVAGVSIQGAGATTALRSVNQVMEFLREQH